MVESEMLLNWMSEDMACLLSQSVVLLWGLAGVGIGILLFFLSGKRAGFGYYVFLHESWSMGDVKRYYRGLRRPLGRVFALRLSLTGWVALSVVGCLIPFLVHTIPYGLCLFACYAATLERRCK